MKPPPGHWHWQPRATIEVLHKSANESCLPRHPTQMPFAPAQLALFLLLATATGDCSPRRYCDTKHCTTPSAFENDGFSLLGAHTQLQKSVNVAVAIAQTFPGLRTNDDLDIHTSWMYLCCLTLEEHLRAAVALTSVKWAPVNISYSSAVCNVDGSLILMADAASQAALGAQVAAFEAALVAAGIPVAVPRAAMEGFHLTLGTANSSYDFEGALAAINRAVPPGTWTEPFPLKNFAFFTPPYEVSAHE